jgi:phospholipid-binding lipoprotein MlaA
LINFLKFTIVCIYYRKGIVLAQKLLFICACLSLSACSTSNDPNDPLEPINRPIFFVNNVLDQTLVRPTTLAFEAVAPLPVKKGMANFYYNMSQTSVFLNCALQGKPDQATTTLARFLINATLGIGGIFDVAGELGVGSYREDFGKTFASWGWKNSTYVVIPLIGPSTIRDGIGYTVSMYSAPQYYLLSKKARNEYFAGYLIDKRRQLSKIESVLDNAGVDQYAFVRSSFMQNRAYALDDDGSGKASTKSNDLMMSGPPE